MIARITQHVATTVSIVIAASLVIALTVVPMVAARLLRKEAEAVGRKGRSARAYTATLRTALRLRARFGVFFDRPTYGVDRTVRAGLGDVSLFLPLADAPTIAQAAPQMPLSPAARKELVRLFALDADALPEHSIFQERGFLEAETAMLVPGPGLEPHIDPLEVRVRTALAGAPLTRYLHTSPELALKRIVAAGGERVFQVARVASR